MLHLTLDTSSASAGEVEDRLNELAEQAQPSDSDSITPLLAHGRLLRDLLPAVDNTLKAMRAVPRKRDQDALRSMVLVRQLASRTTARQFRRVLYGTSLLLVGFLVYLGLRLRGRAKALQRRAALEHVIAGISMQFIDAQPQNIDAGIEQALADMAREIGPDRTYFVRSGPEARSYVWSRPGRGFPPGWPERAPALAARSIPLSTALSGFPASIGCRQEKTRAHALPWVWGDGHARPMSARTATASLSASMRLAGPVAFRRRTNSVCCGWRSTPSSMRSGGKPWKRNGRGWRRVCSRPVVWKR